MRFFSLYHKRLCLLIAITVNIFILLITYESIFRSNSKNHGIFSQITHNITNVLQTGVDSDIMKSNQLCQIPKLDPYHPDVLPYIKRIPVNRCTYKSIALVENGILYIAQKENVMSAKYAYIRRINDNMNRLSEWVVFFEDGEKDERVVLTEDFVKVSITAKKSNETAEEYHMYPTRHRKAGNLEEQNKTKATSRNPHQLNVVMLMVDSLSHASGVRYLPKTYKMLKEDNDSVILNGHTIVGDGTTAQICAMFIGELEHDLPEARRGFPNSGTVDRWPFIYKDLHAAGYTTLYSEDSPSDNTFNFRLNGFRDAPTSKYIRNFWIESKPYVNKLLQNSASCLHNLALKYVRDLLNEYSDKPTFTFAAFSELAHNNIYRAQLADDDFIEFFEWLERKNYRHNTIVILFGDHGERSSAFRSTMQGKLEERLPLMTFSFPPWFQKQFPQEFHNFQRSANMLTSHFDIHSTLRHLINFPVNKYTHNRGKSLFSDIVSLNRTCADVGVKEHWCSCLDLENVPINSSVIITIAEYLVEHINKKVWQVEDAKGKCEKLKLKKVLRARKIKANSMVQKFSATFRDGKCDECGVREADNKFKTTNYEIVFSVSPSDGEYETIAIYNEENKKITSSNEISRINLYGSQPKCVEQKFPYLRPYCYCKN